MSDERRRFLRWIGYGLLGIVALFFGSMIKSALYRLKAEAGPRYLPLDLPSGVTFHQGIIVNRYKHKYVIMSARCTHLGCMVDRRQGDELVCPCHGSKFSLDGKVLSGPATRDLARVRFHVDSKERRIIIEPPA